MLHFCGSLPANCLAIALFFPALGAVAAAAAVWQDIGMPTAVARESANLDAGGGRVQN